MPPPPTAIDHPTDALHGDACCGGLLARHLGALADQRVPEASAPRPGHRGTFVVRGATVLPVDDSFSEAEAFAVRDGRILAVGTDVEVAAAAGEDATVIDRAGAFVLPGFVEPHAHVMLSGIQSSFVDVRPQRFDDVAAVLAHLRTEVPTDGSWLVAGQFDPSLQAGPDVLTADDLDGISADIPVILLNASGHLAYANHAALAAAGITRDTPDIDGSPYGRDSDGAPNGVLQGQPAMMSVLAMAPNLGRVDLAEAIRDTARRASAKGITTICDQSTGMTLGPAEVEMYGALAADGLAVRLRYSLWGTSGDALVAAGIGPGHGDAQVRATGWKMVSDGSNQGRTGLQREPYLGTGSRGIAYLERDDLIADAARRAADGWQVVIHANGDAAIDNALDALAAAVDAGGPDRRHRIEHCSILHDEQIARIAELEVSPSFLIGHVHYWGQAFRDEIFGPEKADLLDRTASCSARGIRWTIHSDDSVTPMDPMRCIHNAVTRDLWRDPGTPLNAGERVSVEAAIRSMTADAAWQCHSDHEIGSLEPGKLADFVVLAEDPRSVDPSALAQVEVLETWMGGERRT